MTSVWDDPDLKFVDEFVKLENVGDGFKGKITHIRSHRFEDGSVAAQISFVDTADGVERTWSAGQVQAKRKLAELRPEVGWWIRVQLTQIEKRGSKTLKHLDIEAQPGADQRPVASTAPATFANGPAPAAAAPAYAPPVSVPPAVGPGGVDLPCPPGIDPAAWAQMAMTQKEQMYQALGLPVPQAAPAQQADMFTGVAPF